MTRRTTLGLGPAAILTLAAVLTVASFPDVRRACRGLGQRHLR